MPHGVGALDPRSAMCCDHRLDAWAAGHGNRDSRLKIRDHSGATSISFCFAATESGPVGSVRVGVMDAILPKRQSQVGTVLVRGRMRGTHGPSRVVRSGARGWGLRVRPGPTSRYGGHPVRRAESVLLLRWRAFGMANLAASIIATLAGHRIASSAHESGVSGTLPTAHSSHRHSDGSGLHRHPGGVSFHQRGTSGFRDWHRPVAGAHEPMGSMTQGHLAQ